MYLDLSIAEIVKRVFEDCFYTDINNPDRIAFNEPEKYIADFKDYRVDYSKLEQLGLGIRIVSPEEVGYLLGRNGECIDLVLHMIGVKYNSKDLEKYADRFESLQTLDKPADNCAVIYYSGVPMLFQEVREHIGFFIDGKVISKWGSGPIFEHDISAVPYVSYIRVRYATANDKLFPKTHRVEFKSLEGLCSK